MRLLANNLCVSLFFLPFVVFAQPKSDGMRPPGALPSQIVVHAGATGVPIQPTMWGIFFEDINMAADGGLYAELVKNRSFEFNIPLMGWKEHKSAPADGSVLVINRQAENPSNPRYVRLAHYTDGPFGLSNEGFRGMGIRKDETYHFSVLARVGGSPSPVRTEGSPSLALRVELMNPDGRSIGSGRVSLSGGDWKKDTLSITSNTTEPHAQLYLWLEGQGSVDLDMISLFP